MSVVTISTLLKRKDLVVALVFTGDIVRTPQPRTYRNTANQGPPMHQCRTIVPVILPTEFRAIIPIYAFPRKFVVEEGDCQGKPRATKCETYRVILCDEASIVFC